MITYFKFFDGRDISPTIKELISLPEYEHLADNLYPHWFIRYSLTGNQEDAINNERAEMNQWLIDNCMHGYDATPTNHAWAGLIIKLYHQDDVTAFNLRWNNGSR